MKNKTLVAGCLLAMIFSSCIKDKNIPAEPDALTPPSGFLWEMSRNVQLNIGINDNRFGNAIHTIAVYGGNPLDGGKLITKGAASDGKPFISTIYLTDTLQSLFIVKTAPDNSAMQKEFTISSNIITVTIGAVPVPSGKPMEGPDCNTGCSRTITKSDNDIDVKNGETVCITGDDITVSYTANNKGTVRICGKNVTVQNSNLNNKSTLIIAETGSVNFQNLNINGGISFENYGTCSIDGGFSPNGPVINTGSLSIASDFNISNSGSLNNRGTIAVKGNTNVNSRGNLNKGKISTENFTVNSGADFTNLCGLFVANNYNSNGTMANYQLITVGATTTINSQSELGLYNSAMITTSDIVLNGSIKGYGTTSLAKVYNHTTINSDAAINGDVQFCDENGIEENYAGKYGGFVNGAVAACDVYVPAGSCNDTGNGLPLVKDTDADGVADDMDDYPDDAMKAFNNYYPADGSKVTITFEDLWPYKGDFDFNDLVMDYRYNIITNAGNSVATVTGDFRLLAGGGAFNNGFGVEFPVAGSIVKNVRGGTLEANQAKAVIILFNDMHKHLQWSNTDETKPSSTPVPFTVSFDLKNGPLLSSFGIGNYNPFTWNNATATATSRNEIHLPGQANTTIGSAGLFGSGDDNSSASKNWFYVSKDGMPWALTIPTTFKYPKEGANMKDAYKYFIAWANSGGAAYPNWYVDEPGYRTNSFIYKP